MPNPKEIKVSPGDPQIELMRAAGIKDYQIALLQRLKDRVKSRQVDDLTMEYKRLLFLKYRAERGDFASDGFFPKRGVIFESTPTQQSLTAPAKI